jgi:hypothetical protein
MTRLLVAAGRAYVTAAIRGGRASAARRLQGYSAAGRRYPVPPSRLSSLQEQVLIALSGLQPAWTLTGGAALAGFHTSTATPRSRSVLPPRDDTRIARRRCDSHAPVCRHERQRCAHHRHLRTTRCSPCHRVRGCRPRRRPTPIAEAAQPFAVGTATILVETPHQLLVNKLCALLSRSELRDLIDVRVLIESGLDLTRALADCPGHDAGFSPLTFAWSARALPIRRVAAAQGWPRHGNRRSRAMRDDLVARVIAQSQPDKPM